MLKLQFLSITWTKLNVLKWEHKNTSFLIAADETGRDIALKDFCFLVSAMTP